LIASVLVLRRRRRAITIPRRGRRQVFEELPELIARQRAVVIQVRAIEDLIRARTARGAPAVALTVLTTLTLSIARRRRTILPTLPARTLIRRLPLRVATLRSTVLLRQRETRGC